MKKVLIAIDNGPSAEKIAVAGFELAKKPESMIAIESVIETDFLVTDGGVTPEELVLIIKNNFRKQQQLLMDTVFKDSPVWQFVENGKPFEAIHKDCLLFLRRRSKHWN